MIPWPPMSAITEKVLIYLGAIVVLFAVVILIAWLLVQLARVVIPDQRPPADPTQRPKGSRRIPRYWEEKERKV